MHTCHQQMQYTHSETETAERLLREVELYIEGSTESIYVRAFATRSWAGVGWSNGVGARSTKERL